MKKKTISLLMAASLATASLAGGIVSFAEESDPITLSVWAPFTGSDGDVLREIIDNYNETNTDNITVQIDIMLKNTVIFAGCVTVISLFFDSLAAYAFSRMQFRGRKIIFSIILLTMMIPFQVIMIPLYLEEFNLKILNTYLGLILPRTASAYGIYMLTSFFSGVPKSLDEAARIDGMKEFQIYSRIIAPLAKPAFVTLGIYHFMNNWNDLLYPMMLTSSVDMRTLSAGLAILVGSNSIKFGPTLAATVISVAPLLILFLFGQRFFMEGIATSGMKE